MPAASMPRRVDDEDLRERYCVPFSSLTAPVEVGEIGSSRAGTPAFFSLPPLGPLLFANEASDARDHCANERTFLSYLRLSVYMAVVSVAVTLSFHVRQRPSEAELKVARPLGAVFWVLSVVLLFLGLGNYIRTVNRYSQKVAIVQTGWKTQLGLGILGSSIVVASVVLLVLEETDVADTAKITDFLLSWI